MKVNICGIEHTIIECDDKFDVDTHMGMIERIILVAGGLMMIVPGTVTDFAGLALIAAGVALQFFKRNKAAAAA